MYRANEAWLHDHAAHQRRTGLLYANGMARLADNQALLILQNILCAISEISTPLVNENFMPTSGVFAFPIQIDRTMTWTFSSLRRNQRQRLKLLGAARSDVVKGWEARLPVTEHDVLFEAVPSKKRAVLEM